MILGVPFPLAYVKFYKRKTAYTEATQEAVTAVQETPQQAQEQTVSTLQLVESTGNTEFAKEIAKHAPFILKSRGDKKNGVQFNDFQDNIMKEKTDVAYQILINYMQAVPTDKKYQKRTKEAKEILKLINKV